MNADSKQSFRLDLRSKLCENENYKSVQKSVEEWLKRSWPDFFGDSPSRPHLHLKPKKIIRDRVWGILEFSAFEMALIDSPVLQRLRRIKQTSCADYVYPTLTHSRFEHSLGVAHVAGEIFDSIARQNVSAVKEFLEPRHRAEVRAAALLHDAGHCAFSHTFEQVYSQDSTVKGAAKAVSDFTGKDIGAAELFSICIILSDCLEKYLENAQQKLKGASEEAEDAFREAQDGFDGVDLGNVALLVTGRYSKPRGQFLADIISSAVDADKIDYLLRDASAAGLSVLSDFERYLHVVGVLEQKMQVRKSAGIGAFWRFPESDGDDVEVTTYRLGVGMEAVSTIEQIVISKILLYSYVYNHPKVRAADGALRILLEKFLDEKCKSVIDILRITDDVIHNLSPIYPERGDVIGELAYRWCNRILPREVIGFAPEDFKAELEKQLIKEQFSEKSAELIVEVIQIAVAELEDEDIRKELEDKIREKLGVSDDSLKRHLVWIDPALCPKDREIREVRVKARGGGAVELEKVVPMTAWISAYRSFRLERRVFVPSELWEKAKEKVVESFIEFFASRLDSEVLDELVNGQGQRGGQKAEEAIRTAMKRALEAFLRQR